MSNAPAAAVASLSFEDALAELEAIVRQLEAGQVPLDATIGLYDRATALKQHCETRLKDAEMRIERIVAGPGGSVGTAPFDENG
jgi:exodeoxyribonuclease VII small subunit